MLRYKRLELPACSFLFPFFLLLRYDLPHQTLDGQSQDDRPVGRFRLTSLQEPPTASALPTVTKCAVAFIRHRAFFAVVTLQTYRLAVAHIYATREKASDATLRVAVLSDLADWAYLCYQFHRFLLIVDLPHQRRTISSAGRPVRTYWTTCYVLRPAERCAVLVLLGVSDF